MKIFLLWAVVFNVLSYGLFVDKDSCRLILKGCLEVKSHCKYQEEIFAVSTQSEILGYINGVDRAYSKFGYTLKYDKTYSHLFNYISPLRTDPIVKDICKKVLNSSKDGMNIDGIVESFYPKDKIKRLNRIGEAEKIAGIIILDKKNPLIHKRLMCNKTSKIALPTDNKGWESFEVLGTSAVNMNVKTSTGEYFYFTRELSQFIQYMDNHATGFTSVIVNSLDSVSLTFSYGNDLIFVDYKCKAIE